MCVGIIFFDYLWGAGIAATDKTKGQEDFNMEHTIDDLLALVKVMSEKEVTIAELKSQLKMQEDKNAMLESRNMALEEQCCKLEEQVQTLQTRCNMMADVAFVASMQNVDLLKQMKTMQQVIWLSVKKVKYFFDHLMDMTLQANLRSFVLDTLPDSAPPEYRSFVQDVTRQRLSSEGSKTIHVAGNYNDVHDNGQVACNK